MAIYVEIDGKTTPITECAWVQIAPCGCIDMVASAQPGRDGTPLTTEALMLAEYEIPKWQQDEDRANGFVYRLVERAEFIDRFKEQGNCKHDPKWGRPPRASREGYEWASKRKSRVFHLVPTGAVWNIKESLTDVEKNAESLCEVTAYVWGEARFESRPDCKNCTKIAREQARS